MMAPGATLALLRLKFACAVRAGRGTLRLTEGRVRIPALLAMALGAMPMFAQNAPPKTSLKIGDTAPDFTISGRMNTSGKDIKLSDFRGKKIVILAFFPAAFTGG
jgi:AhpC/TSA family